MSICRKKNPGCFNSDAEYTLLSCAQIKDMSVLKLKHWQMRTVSNSPIKSRYPPLLLHPNYWDCWCFLSVILVIMICSFTGEISKEEAVLGTVAYNSLRDSFFLHVPYFLLPDILSEPFLNTAGNWFTESYNSRAAWDLSNYASLCKSLRSKKMKD